MDTITCQTKEKKKLIKCAKISLFLLMGGPNKSLVLYFPMEL